MRCPNCGREIHYFIAMNGGEVVDYYLVVDDKILVGNVGEGLVDLVCPYCKSAVMKIEVSKNGEERINIRD